MNKTSIYYKKRNSLINELEKNDLIQTVKDKSLLKKLSFLKQEYADIYFHSGLIDEKASEFAFNAKLIIVNSLNLKYQFINEYKIEENKVEVIYPSVSIPSKKPKAIKEKICKEFELNPKSKIILFTAKNLKASGINEFIQIIFALYYQNIQVLIAGDAKQIYNLKFQLSKFNFEDKLLLIEDYKNMENLFLASDIFVLPTYNKYFSFDVLKAMACKCAVFVSSTNHAKELIDVYSTMDKPSDRSTAFKIDALLNNKDELKLIKKQNQKVAIEYTLDKNLERLNDFIARV